MQTLSDITQALAKLSDADQLSILVDLIQGGTAAGLRSDAFIDALIPVEAAFVAAYDELAAAADAGDALPRFNPSMVHPDNPCQSMGWAA